MSGPSQPQQTLRQLREERGWTQEQLARRLGVAQGAVSKWERGQRLPSPRRLQALTDLFGVQVSEITFGADEQP